jgi:hypothetical protein
VRSKRNEANWGAAAEQSLANIRQILAARAGRLDLTVPVSSRWVTKACRSECGSDGFLDTAALAHDAASQRYWGPVIRVPGDVAQE